MPKARTAKTRKKSGAIRRIAIASDPLMTKETEQFSNRRWMKDILARPLEMATGIKPISLASSRSNPELINRTEFFQKSGISVDLDATQFWFDDAQISQDSLDYLRQFVDADTLVIGYELSRQTRAVLERLGTPFVDIWLHPVRFLDDILFTVNSNFPAYGKNSSPTTCRRQRCISMPTASACRLTRAGDASRPRSDRHRPFSSGR